MSVRFYREGKGDSSRWQRLQRSKRHRVLGEGLLAMINLFSTRFGDLEIAEEDILTFADGLIGMEHCQQWVLLGDAENSALGWLQSVDRPEIALAVVSPRRFVPDYQIRVSKRDILALGLAEPVRAQVLAVVSHAGESLAMNLKAPLLVHVEQRLGRQIVARDDHSVQHRLVAAGQLRKTA
jgi:flagellar assembly factor FliW